MRKTREQKNDEAIMDCYVELYLNSTPSADFKDLMEKALLNERGQKVIDFNSYEIEEEKYDEIVESMIKKHKFKGYMVQQFKNTIALGCSPKCIWKQKDN